MRRKSSIEGDTQASNYQRMTGPDFLRHQQREQALEWVSHNAPSALRSKWRKAKLVDNGVD